MAEPFPAITRAAQRFRARSKREQAPADHVEGDDGRNGGRDQLMAQLSLELDEDLATIRNDVGRLHEDVASDYERVRASVDELMASFAADTRHKRSEQSVDCSLENRSRGQMIRIHAAKRSRQRRRRLPLAQVCLRPAAGNDAPRDVATKKIASTRAARLAMEALAATTIQRAAKWFLYTILYPRGQEQFQAAVSTGLRNWKNRWLCRWILVVRRRKRLRRKLLRAEWQISRDLVDQCVAGAERVVATDGKYAQAKEFHRLRLLGEFLLAWIHGTACNDEACCGLDHL